MPGRMVVTIWDKIAFICISLFAVKATQEDVQFRQTAFSAYQSPNLCKVSHIMTLPVRNRIRCASTCISNKCSFYQYNSTGKCHLYVEHPPGNGPQDNSPFYAADHYLETEKSMIEDGWSLFVRRQDGSVDFDLPWADYRDRFGDPGGEFWLGLETLHCLTANQPHRLRAEMTDWNDQEYFTEYSSFQVGAESTGYVLSVSGYDSSSTAGDALSVYDGRKFSTLDVDNDGQSYSCAQDRTGGWWYWRCTRSHPTGTYYHQMTFDTKGLHWNDVPEFSSSYSFKSMKLMIKKL